jgi:hypothetical protein
MRFSSGAVPSVCCKSSVPGFPWERRSACRKGRYGSSGVPASQQFPSRACPHRPVLSMPDPRTTSARLLLTPAAAAAYVSCGFLSSASRPMRASRSSESRALARPVRRTECSAVDLGSVDTPACPAFRRPIVPRRAASVNTRPTMVTYIVVTYKVTVSLMAGIALSSGFQSSLRFPQLGYREWRWGATGRAHVDEAGLAGWVADRPCFQRGPRASPGACEACYVRDALWQSENSTHRW